MIAHGAEFALHKTRLSTLKVITTTNRIPIGNHLANELRSSFVQPLCTERAALSSDARLYIYSLIGAREEKCGKRREIFSEMDYFQSRNFAKTLLPYRLLQTQIHGRLP